ncbi:MAG: hypothetical protein RLO50_18665 [Azospirillaceae bacterium]
MMRRILTGAALVLATAGSGLAQDASFGPALGDGEMGAARATNAADPAPSVTGNTVDQGAGASFSNEIGGGSFDDFSGIANVVQNNGSAAAIEVETNMTLNVVRN